MDPETPFDSIENAHEYVLLLLETIREAKREVEVDMASVVGPGSDRRLEAFRLVQFKLDKLEQHLRNGGRLLNDLRTLRRLLLDERHRSASGDDQTVRT